MAIDSAAPRSRRALLTAGLAAGAAAVTTAVTRPLAAIAANGDAVTVGGSFVATGATTIGNTTTAAPVIVANSVTGVGLVASSDSERGVLGVSNSASGVQGVSTSGNGVEGFSSTAHALHGEATATGVGVYAKAPAGGVALRTSGKVIFSRSGKVTMAAGTSSKTVTLAGVTTSSMIFAVLSSNRSGRYVRAVVPAAGSFKIYLNTAVLSSTSVSWFALN